MTLKEIVANISNIDEDLTIYAKEPWQTTSIAIAELEESCQSKETSSHKFEYFLEVFIAKEFLQDWEESLDHIPTLEEKTNRLIQYADNDA